MLINDVEHPSLNCTISMGKYFGFLLSTFLILRLTMSQADHGIEAQSLAYAVIRQVNLLDEVAGGIKYYKDLGPIVSVDLNQVKCVIGRIMDWGKWVIIDQCTNT